MIRQAWFRREADGLKRRVKIKKVRAALLEALLWVIAFSPLVVFLLWLLWVDL